MAKKIKDAPADNQVDIFKPINEKTGNIYTEEQQEFIEFKSKKSVILAATAGSGKTFSSIHRLKKLLERGVDPSKMIFFSFTKAATEELKKRVSKEVSKMNVSRSKADQIDADKLKITTIHSYCASVLFKTGNGRPITLFFEFIDWYKKKFKPSNSDSPKTKDEYFSSIDRLYDEFDFLSSAIGAFKLQQADGIKAMVPNFFMQYVQFQKEKKKMDFSDMLIRVRDLFKQDKWLKMFKNKYEYIFIDEYQDTSTIQLQILLSLNAKYYYLIGDRNQSIYGYSGSNCQMLESMVRERRETKEMSLSVNFRSDMAIIENSNKYSSLKAVSNSKEEGFVNKDILCSLEDLVKILKRKDEVAVLVRTNSVIKKLELELLKMKFPMRYFNYISETEISSFEKKGEINTITKMKLDKLKKYIGSAKEVFDFIKSNKNSNKLITTIHKSKGREFEFCVIVNSIAPDVLKYNGIVGLTKKQLKKISFKLDDQDEEPKNIHYVGVSRAKHGNYFMAYE